MRCQSISSGLQLRDRKLILFFGQTILLEFNHSSWGDQWIRVVLVFICSYSESINRGKQKCKQSKTMANNCHLNIQFLLLHLRFIGWVSKGDTTTWSISSHRDNQFQLSLIKNSRNRSHLKRSSKKGIVADERTKMASLLMIILGWVEFYCTLKQICVDYVITRDGNKKKIRTLKQDYLFYLDAKKLE